MTPQMVVAIGREALMLTVMMSGPLLLFALVVGLIIVWGKGNLEWIRELKEPQDRE